MIDFSTVRPEHREIDARLANWGRWCHGRSGTSNMPVQPMFAMYQAPARARSQYGVMTASSTDGQDAMKVAEAIRQLDQPQRIILAWCYVKPQGPGAQAKRMGLTLGEMRSLLDTARNDLIEELAKPLDN